MTATLAIAAPAYEPPALSWRGEPAETDGYVWWVVLVGFAYALALAWSVWCRRHGGYSEISFGWTGFRVSCHR